MNMKILHSAVRDLSDREFDNLSDKISDSLYDLDSGIKEIYKIHIDFIDNIWYVEFVPEDSKTPVIKVRAYTVYDDTDAEVLKITPIDIIKFAEKQHFDSYNNAIDFASRLQVILDFLIELYEFEYKL